MANDDDILKDVMLDIVAYCEKLYFERTALEAVLATSSDSDWRRHYKTALQNDALRSAVHAKFEPALELLQRLVEQGRAAEDIRELLRRLPASKLIH